MTDITHELASGRTWPRRLGIALAILVVIGVAGALYVRGQLDLGAPVAGVTEVAVIDDRFEPPVIEIPAGTEVTWTWQGENDHNVVGRGFESPLQASGSFTHTFSEAGTFDYLCTLHPFMRGQVVVTSPAAQGADTAAN